MLMKKYSIHKAKSNINNKNRGFTLIELMVTVSIAAILLSIAVPSFKTMLKNNRVTTSSNEFVAALILARSEALKRNNTVSVCTTTDQQSCSNSTDFANGWIVFLNCNDDGSIDNGASDTSCDGAPEEIIKVHEKLNKVSIKSTGEAKSILTYQYSGRSDTVTLELKEEGKNTVEKKIIISRTGRVKTQ